MFCVKMYRGSEWICRSPRLSMGRPSVSSKLTSSRLPSFLGPHVFISLFLPQRALNSSSCLPVNCETSQFSVQPWTSLGVASCLISLSLAWCVHTQQMAHALREEYTQLPWVFSSTFNNHFTSMGNFGGRVSLTSVISSQRPGHTLKHKHCHPKRPLFNMSYRNTFPRILSTSNVKGSLFLPEALL